MFYFAEIKDGKVFALHEVSSLDLKFSDSDGKLLSLTEQEWGLLRVCKGDVDKGVSILLKIGLRIDYIIATEKQ